MLRLWIQFLPRRLAASVRRRVVDPTPADCGGHGKLYSGPDFLTETSPDQARINAWLQPRLHASARVLVVGTGTCSLTADHIDGITLSAAEAAVAPRHYQVVVADKHTLPFRGPYDWIVDNNPTSFACCRLHADALLDAYAAALAPGGRLVTDRAGLRYCEGAGFPMGWRDWEREGRRRGRIARRETADVWTWS